MSYGVAKLCKKVAPAGLSGYTFAEEVEIVFALHTSNFS